MENNNPDPGEYAAVAPPAIDCEEDRISLDFIAAPFDRVRHDGWSEKRQRQFVAALAAMGSVGKALKAVGMGRVSAYALRKRKGAESFAAAWDDALHRGRMEQYSYAMDRAVNGVTTIRVRRGGTIEVQALPDIEIMRAALREQPGAG